MLCTVALTCFGMNVVLGLLCCLGYFRLSGLLLERLLVLLRLRVLLWLSVLGLLRLFEWMGCFSGLYVVGMRCGVKEGVRVLWRRRSRTIGAQRDGGMLTLEGLLGLDDMEVDSYLNNINNNDLILKLINAYVYAYAYVNVVLYIIIMCSVIC